MPCVPIPPWVEIAIRAFSRCWRGYLPWLVHFGLVRFFRAISTGLPETRGTEDGVGGAAFVCLCAITLALQAFPRGIRWGYAPPNLRQRVFDSLDSLHAAAGLCLYVDAPPSPGYTERPARL